MKKQHVILAILALVILGILFWPTDDYKIVAIDDGNMVTLNNGTRVKLIGVSATQEGKEYLEDNYFKVPVALISDLSAPFNPNYLDGKETIYAYVLTKHGHCINSESAV